MARLFGWVLAGLAAVLGIVGVVAVAYLFAPVAPSLWLLVLISLAAGLLVALLPIRFIVRGMRWRTSRPYVVAGLLTLSPFAALATWVLITPLPLVQPPSPDPRGAPTFATLPTGSKLATWTLAGEGERRRTPVVFLHGGPGYYVKRRDLTMGAAFRRAGFDTVYYDQAGSGASSDLPTAEYTVARQVADLDALRLRLRADRLILWGESWGAVLAARYALAHPDRIAGAVFSSPGEYPGMPEARLDYSGVMRGAEPSRPPQSMILYILLTRAPHLAESWMDQRTARLVGNAASAVTLTGPGPRCKGAAWDGKPRPPTASSSVYTLRRLLLDEFAQPAPSSRQFKAPALIVRGGCDFIPDVVAQRYAAAYPGASVVRIPGAGHSLLDHEAEFDRAAAQFAQQRLASIR